ncbi:hypothetical protein NQ176_g4416 [Zarea fungicola]|uniref:Uncharacterized protein n=1 Tax=Zarea fungicola TaxID=93591 RepID=A0ACC1NEY6_9HYPO|nr:hypothetical protein NQ176_g4416 [Lecanicillium fungicola]
MAETGEEYYNLGAYTRAISTDSPEAQLWFDRGLIWSYSFNHEESLRCFQRAAEHDPECALIHWGLLYAIGPNYNKTWRLSGAADVEKTTEYAAGVLVQARRASNGSPLERALVEAIATRFAPVGAIPEDLGTLNEAYAVAMRKVYREYGSDDLDVAALFADSLMCIRPRALWDLDTGEPTTNDTLEAVAVLDAAFTQPGSHDHPALSHLYIHLMEMAADPGIAVPAANRLRNLVPEASHMAHMATHIDIAVGDYREGIKSNQDAVTSDDKFFAREDPTVMYTVYRSHTIQVLVYAAMMAGRWEDAITAANRLPKILPPEFLSIKSPSMADWAEFYLATDAHVLIRFGRWEEIVQLQIPTDQQLMPITTAMYRYARGIALGVLGRLDEARAEAKEFEAVRSAVPEDRMNGTTSRAFFILEVASLMLEGELLYREGHIETAFATLREGIKKEDNLAYCDPPLRMQPLRHVLGALLLEQGRLSEAEEIYKQDLGLSKNLPRRKSRPNNVWGWQGLYECYLRSGKQEEALKIKSRHDDAMALADIPVAASCFCRLSTVNKSNVGCC